MTQTTALLLTLAIEVPVATALVAAARWAPGRLGTVAAVAVGASLFTHPLLWMAQEAGLIRGMAGVVAAELAVAAVEAAAYAWAAGIGLRRGAVVSLVANAASFATGLLLVG